MPREFNDTGVCVANRHYMVDTSAKIARILTLIEKGKYVCINRPRQFGKTTTLSLLARTLNAMPDYLALNISFEDIDTETYQHQERFIAVFLDMLMEEFEYLNFPDACQFLEERTNRSRWTFPPLPTSSTITPPLIPIW